MIEDISFKQYKKKSDIHGTVLYPAVMVAPIQKAILTDLLDKDSIRVIFDPFHGSGTALYECSEISREVHLVGCDINPLANLITKVKLNGVNENFKNDLEQLRREVTSLTYGDNHTFEKIDKWFKADIAEALRVLRTAIKEIKDTQNRMYFWYMLCDIIRKYSNTRSSTYKLHKREDDAIQRIENKVIDDYFASVERSWMKFCSSNDNFELYKCNVVEQIKKFKERAFDITITSPPYGDNGTTVPYGQFSMLALLWIDKKDLELEGWEYENYSIIDSKSIGGCFSSVELSKDEFVLIEPYLKAISERKHKKVKRFFAGYFEVLRNICRVTDKYVVLTLGNRTVDRVKINLTKITREFMEQNDFEHMRTFEREIPSKRTPKKTSRINDAPVESMNSEFITIYQRLGN